MAKEMPEAPKHEPPKPKFVKPYEPENLHLSRDEYEKRQREKAEKRAKIEAFEKELDTQKTEKKEETETKDKPKGKRPKKID